MKRKNQNLRFAIMLDSMVLKNWQIKCIEKLISNPLNELVLIIKNDSVEKYNSKKLPIGFRFLESQLRSCPLFQSKDITNQYKSTTSIKCTPQEKKGSNYIEEKDLNKIKTYKLDFILRFGFGIIKGEILDLPKFGIWSFHHGNPREYRGGPPSFWEFKQGRKSNGVILQRLNSRLDAGEILREGNVAVLAHSFLEHTSRLFELGTDFPSWVCSSIRSRGELQSTPITEKGNIYKIPNNIAVLKFYIKLIISKMRFHYIQLFQGEIWNIGVAKSIVEKSDRKEVSEILWAPEGKSNTYKADPFWGESNKIYFENYDYKKLKGDVNSIEFTDNIWSTEEVIRQDNTHYSYPFFLREDTKKYILPENFQANKLELHEIIEGKIVDSKILLKGNWIDPTLINHNNKWWLFVTPQKSSNEALYLFYSDNLDGEYIAHPLNPVRIDICSARPGGTPFLNKKGKLIRPSQNSERTYGASIVFNEIIEMTESNYIETKVDEIFPDPSSKYNQALHTFSYQGDNILIDGKRVTFIFSSFWSQLKRKLKRVFRK